MADAENPLDLPFLAEALLFYGSVEILLNRTSLHQLIREIKPDHLLEFLGRGYISLKFEPNFTGIVTENSGTSSERYLPTVAQIDRQQLLDLMRPLVINFVGKEGKGRRLALRLVAQIPSAPIDQQLAARFADDLIVPGYLLNGAKTVLQTILPEVALATDARFEAVPLGDKRFRIETNLDFHSINEAYHRRVPVSHSSLSPAYLLAQLLTARKILEDGARDESELAVAPVYAALISLQVSTALQRRMGSASEIKAFQDLIFDNGRNLAGVFAAGERTFSDLLPLLDKALKFRGWLQEREPSSTLIKDYFRAVTEGSWADKLPIKITRWSLFTGAGLAIDAAGAGGLGTAGAILLGAADAFFLDKITKGWRPDQFIEGPLKRFVRPE